MQEDEQEDEQEEEATDQETNPGSRAGPGASEKIFRKDDYSQKHFNLCCSIFLFGPEVHIYTGCNGCTTRSDQDNKVETVF